MESRIQKSMRNTVFGAIGLFCSLVVSFITRSIFIQILGVEYNGVNGLFSNILQVLNLAELGFATSIAYALYKPLKEHDEKKAAALMNYFSRIYRIIAVIVAVAGCICLPFLQYLISEDISDLSFSLGQLRIYFAIYLANTVCSYLLAYKRTIITADQNSYLISLVDNSGNIVLNLVQIALLYLTRNFYAYLAIMIAKTIINNLVLHLIAGKRYPYLSQYKREVLSLEERSIIFKNVRALFFHRIGGVIVISTSSIVISAFVSLIDAGKYSNYMMIVSNVGAFIDIIFSSVTASIGNLCLDKDKEYQYLTFKRISYISNFFIVFTLTCYICLFNDFIGIWVGDDMQFSLAVVIAISLNATVGYVRKTVLAFKDAMGLFRQDRFKPLIESGVGISLAIGLSYVWGTFGVIIGYTIATVVIAIPVENYVLFKFGLKRSAAGHIVRLLLNVLFAICLTGLTYFICSFIPDGVGWFILEFLFVVIFSAFIYFLVTCGTQEFRFYLNLLRQIVRKLLKRSTEITESPNSSLVEDGSGETEKDCDETMRAGVSQQHKTDLEGDSLSAENHDHID